MSSVSPLDGLKPVLQDEAKARGIDVTDLARAHEGLVRQGRADLL